MSEIIYGLCTLTAFLCAWLLLRAYGRNKYRLLLWGGLCFAGLTISTLFLVIDKLLLGPEIDLAALRSFISLGSLCILLYGLIRHSE